MPDQISLTFLGTAAGRPSPTRNVSSLAVKIDSKLWVFDAGESTQHQFMDARCKLSMGKTEKIFVTHMHADHVNGLPGLLCTISAGEGSVQQGEEDPRIAQSQSIPPTRIYGPSGLRLFLRHCLALTHSTLTRPYQVNELLFPDEEEETGALHPSERPGENIRCDDEGFWRGIIEEKGMRVDVGPILHTIRCLGYLLVESPRPLPIVPSLYTPHLTLPENASALKSQGISNPLTLLSTLQTSREPLTLPNGTILTPPEMGGRGRRILVLGDTFDATPLLPLIESLSSDIDHAHSLYKNDPVKRESLLDLVIHESTNAFLPLHDASQSSSKPNPPSLESVSQLAREHGHSTPQVAGNFARLVKTERLVLNHLSVKYPDPGDEPLAGEEEEENKKNWRGMLREIERQAEESWLGEGNEKREGGEWRVTTARDFMEIEIPRRDKVTGDGGKKEKQKKKAK
ncbi:ribonuclease Z [Sporobolomyces salmoneus]|uniref:ribonuclease Z n=1 Tax=Sporobolomyces salmoneus TaxID=183962 RepID=UPI00316DB4FA